jgi:DNA-binding transcriptional LysR family regulator
MQIDSIRAFVELCSIRNISKCAIKMNLSQQGLSRKIHALEEELGVTLFLRSVKGVMPTKEAQVLLPGMHKCILQYDRAMQDLHAYQEYARDTVTIAVCPGIKEYFGLDFFYRFQQENQDIHVVTKFLDDNEAEKELYSQKCDAAFIDEPVHMNDYESFLVLKSRLCAVVRRDSAWAQKKVISLYDLEGETIYIPDQSHRKTTDFMKAYPDLFATLHISSSMNEYDSYFTMPKFFDGVALTFHFLCSHLDESLVEIPIKEDSYVSLYFCMLKSERENQLLQRMAAYVRKKCAQRKEVIAE